MESHTDPLIPQLQDAYLRLPTYVGSSEDVRRAAHTRLKRRAALGVVAFVAFAGIGAGVGREVLTAESPQASLLVLGSASERWADVHARDWLRSADVVVVAIVADQHQEGNASASDGSGDVIVRRTVDLHIQRSLWSRPGAHVPALVTVQASGWMSRGEGSELWRIAIAQTPRLEIGNAYLIALRTTSCSNAATDDDTGGDLGWSTLGSDAIWAVKDGRIGYGESEGKTVAGNPSQAAPGSFEAKMIGKRPADVEAILGREWESHAHTAQRTC